MLCLRKNKNILLILLKCKSKKNRAGRSWNEERDEWEVWFGLLQ